MQEVPPRHESAKYLPQRLYEFSRRYKALLQTAGPTTVLGIPLLLQELSQLLHGIFDFNFISYSLADSSLHVSHFISLTPVEHWRSRSNFRSIIPPRAGSG